MRGLVQRVAGAAVTVEGQEVGRIGAGLLVLVGIETRDAEADLAWMAAKLAKLRVFADDAGVMNRSVCDVGGEVLAVSQFTLFASYSKGNRPSWGRAAPGPVSEPLFERFVSLLSAELGRPVPTGVFGADMQVSLVNDGPVTLLLDSKNPE
ncbi:MAG TPA: D-aminoacyl-tRNA deacylase [Chitinolyticbacter sp.]|nr:D-aminoacyl-tRNA deacylase [Chitinolyticbacter sp.]